MCSGLWRTVVFCLIFSGSTLCQDENVYLSTEQATIFEFYPPFIEGLVVGDQQIVRVSAKSNASILNTVTADPLLSGAVIRVIPVEEHPDIVLVHHNGSTIDSSGNISFEFKVEGLFLGRTSLQIVTVELEDDRIISTYPPYPVAVVRPPRMVDSLFIGLVMTIVMLGNIGMGCKVEIEVVKEVLRKPIAPVIGFLCQFMIMPLMSFTLLKVFGFSGGIGLGFFATGCSPAGGSSNMYTYLLKGDVSLSVTMTLISVIASLGMMPLWLMTLGRFIVDERVKIPYGNIFATLAGILIPVGLGLLIQYKKPTWAKKISRVLRPFFVVLLLVVFTMGVATNLYIFRVISPFLILAACLLPYLSFALASLFAFICRQPANRILTIAIETAIQNTGLPIILMKLSLSQPEADLSAVSPVAIACFMPIPLWIAFSVMEIRKRCCAKQDAELVPAEDLEDPKIVKNGDTNLEVAANGNMATPAEEAKC